jgi:phospholipid/cholesterol/gamma-HCH transport system substrate-binding protein
MKTTAGQRIKIGLFTAIGIVVLVLAVFFIGNQKSLFNSTFKVSGRFKNVSGLQIGNNVRFAGINIGVVDDIEIVNDSSVRVVLTINNSVKKFIKKDAKMSIGSDGLMGDKLVVVAPGGGTSNIEVNDGDQINSVNPIDVDRIVAKLTKIEDDAGSLIDNLSQIVVKVNSGKGSIGRLLNSDKLSKDLEGTVTQARGAIANVHQTSATLNQDLTAAQHNFLLKGFFKKKDKAKQDSIKKIQDRMKKDSVKKAKTAKKDSVKNAKNAKKP